MSTINSDSLIEHGLFVGIDPGTQKTNLGLAFVDVVGQPMYYCAVDIHTSPFPRPLPHETHSDRLWHLGTRLASAFQDASLHLWNLPVLLAGIEDQWIGKNKQAGLILSKQWGAIFQILSTFGIYSVRIQPAQAKKALTGYGKATKEDMVRFAQQVGYEGENDNVADAIGIALAARDMYKEFILGQL